MRSLAIGEGNGLAAAGFAESQNWLGRQQIVEALRSVVTAVSTQSAAALMQPIGADFAPAVTPQTIIGRLPGVRRVPFNVRVTTALDAAVAYWHAESVVIPATQDQLSGTTFEARPVSAMAVVSAELLRTAGSAVDLMLSASLSSASAKAIDLALLDPTNTGIAGTKPAALVSGTTAIVASAVTPAAVDTALQSAIAAVVTAGSDLSAAAWVCSPVTATRLASVRGSGGAAAYPALSLKDGELLGLPVLTSRFMSNGVLELIDGSAVVLADDGESNLQLAEHANVELRSDPADDASAVVTSLWQTNLVAMRAIRYIVWKLSIPGRAAYITGIV